MKRRTNDSSFSIATLLLSFAAIIQTSRSFTVPCSQAKTSYIGLAPSRTVPVNYAPSSPSRLYPLLIPNMLNPKPRRNSSVSQTLSSTTESAKEPLFEGLGKGVLRDYKARLPLFWSDIKDGLNIQVRTVFLNINGRFGFMNNKLFLFDAIIESA